MTAIASMPSRRRARVKGLVVGLQRRVGYGRTRAMLRIALCCLLLYACVDLELHADLAGPRVFASSLIRPRNVEVPTLPRIFVDFTEAIDPASVRVALVAWEEVGSCAMTPVCEVEGSSCERGRCMRDPLSVKDVAGLEHAAIEGSVALEPVVPEQSPIAPGSRVWVAPRRALQAHARHSLLVFARDASGAPLVDEDGVVGVWRRDLVTAGEGSGGPEARLVAPPPGSEQVPPNLARIATAFTRPVALSGTLTLEGEDGSVLKLIDPEPCPGWVPGLCLRWRPDGPVLPDMAYRPGGGTLRDLLGRPAVAPAEATWFRTASERDGTSPSLAGVQLVALGPCVYARITSDEPIELRLAVGPHEDVAVGGPGPLVVALRGPFAAAEASLRAEDLAGNLAELSLPVPEDSQTALGLAEILANPRGPEPAQEFVELADLRESGDPRAWTDLHLADLPADVVAAALADGDAPGDALPAFTTRPGERVLVVGASYDPREGSDVAPAPGTALIRVDASLGAGGLKNAGEPVTLYFGPGAVAPGIVASYGDHLATDAAAHAGRSVTADPRACDVARAWASEPGGSATPGAP